jgi:5-formyltetrahydrofolate cyclo-ligase
MHPQDSRLSKKAIRERIWRFLEENDIPIFPRPVYGRIPSFKGQDKAAENLFSTSEWRNARIIKVNPDAPQQPVRLRALEEGKTLIIASPRLRSGFVLIDPKLIPKSTYRTASRISGFMSIGRKLGINDLQRIGRIDLIVEGSVAVNKYGERLGKGEGYGELEYAVLAELGLVGEETPIATTVHDSQVVEDRLPQDPWDAPIDIIATPTRIIRCNRGPRPRGILWDKLSKDKLDEIPLLRELLARKRGAP